MRTASPAPPARKGNGFVPRTPATPAPSRSGPFQNVSVPACACDNLQLCDEEKISSHILRWEAESRAMEMNLGGRSGAVWSSGVRGSHFEEEETRRNRTVGLGRPESDRRARSARRVKASPLSLFYVQRSMEENKNFQSVVSSYKIS